MNLYICYLKIDVSCEASVDFHHFSQKMPRLPGNLHLVVTWRSPDNAIRKNTHDTSEVLRPPCEMTIYDDGHVQSAAPATKTATHLAKTSQKYCACHTHTHTKTTFDTLRNTLRNAATRRWKHPKMTPFAELTMAWPYGPHANGCGRLGNVERTHPQPPRPPEWNRNPCYAFGKKVVA